VVVFDNQYFGGARKLVLQLAGTLFIEARPSRVLTARGDHHSVGTARKSCRQSFRKHPVLVDGDRRKKHPERATEVEHARVARVLDGHNIAGTKVGHEHALNPIQRAAHNHEVVSLDSFRRELCSGKFEEFRDGKACAVEPLP
jgi:hypothetical protein